MSAVLGSRAVSECRYAAETAAMEIHEAFSQVYNFTRLVKKGAARLSGVGVLLDTLLSLLATFFFCFCWRFLVPTGKPAAPHLS